MYEKKIPRTLTCGASLTKDVLNGKWKSTLLHYIARGALNIQLTELEQHGLLSKTIFPQLPPKVECQLTELGRSQLPVIEAMERWGDDHRPHLEKVLAPAAVPVGGGAPGQQLLPKSMRDKF